MGDERVEKKRYSPVWFQKWSASRLESITHGRYFVLFYTLSLRPLLLLPRVWTRTETTTTTTTEQNVNPKTILHGVPEL
jgi:hypothetical protein